MTEASQSLRVFISYARSDGAQFAQDLLTGLEVAGFDPFLDKHDIAAGEDWEARLAGLIQAADTILYVISPASVKSERCGWEVRKAQELSKRILPVVALDVPEAETPEGLRKLNYIIFTGGKSFVAGLREVADTLRSDVVWIREHTRLGERAARWQESARADALLLRGAELAAAREWQVQWRSPAPEPTALHREFINESERAEDALNSAERQRLAEVEAAQAERAKALRRFRTALVGGGVAVLLLFAVAGAGFYALAESRKQLATSQDQVADGKRDLGIEKKRVLDAQLAVVRAYASMEASRVRVDGALYAVESSGRRIDPQMSLLFRELGAQLRQRPNIPLSEHFTLADFTLSETADLRAVNNAPTEEVFLQMLETARQLERVRSLLGDCPLKIVSAYRGPELQIVTGGAPRSAHMTGYAADITCEKFGTPYDVAKAIEKSPIMADLDQLTLETFAVHLSFDPRKRGQVSTSDRGRPTKGIVRIERPASGTP